MFTRQTHVFKVASDCEIKAEVFRSSDQAVRPVIFFLHGGALILGDRHTLPQEQVEKYVGAGYAIVSIDYRLAPEVNFEAVIEDIEDGYRWMVEKGPDLFRVDPRRIVVVGHSVGGFLALLTGFRANPRPKVVSSFHGYGDPTGDWLSRPSNYYNAQPAVSREQAFHAMRGPVITGTAFEGDEFDSRNQFYLYCRQHGLWPKKVTGHCPTEEPRWYDQYCPLRNVTKSFPPTIFVHGEEDFDVPIEQPRLMLKELERHGVPHELVAVPGRGHSFDHENKGMKDFVVAGVFEKLLAFAAKHV